MGLLFRFGLAPFASCLYSDRCVSAAWCNVGTCVLWLVPFDIFCSVRAFGYYFLSLCLRFILWFQLVKNPTRIPCVYGWSIRVGRLFGSCVNNLETYVTLGSPRTVGRWSIPSMAWFFLGLVTPVCSWLCGPTGTFCLCSLNSGSDSWYQSLNALRFPSTGRCLSLEKYFVVIRKILNVRVGITCYGFSVVP